MERLMMDEKICFESVSDKNPIIALQT